MVDALSLHSSSLHTANPQLALTNGVYCDSVSQIRETSLSHYLRTFAHDIIGSVKDLSLFSFELEQSLTTDELRFAFNSAPYNFLLALELNPELGEVLDLSQDLGGVSHYLASKAKHVDSLKIDIGRAQLSAQRCHLLGNIDHFSEDLNALTLPKNAYDLIVLGNINELELTQNELPAFLNKLSISLTNDGCIVFVSDNKNQLNKCLSAGPHTIPYRDLYVDSNNINLDFNELETLIVDSEIKHSNCFANFSLGNKISNLFARDYLLNNPNVLNHFNRIGAVDNADLNEYLLFKSLGREHAFFGKASSYIVIAGRDLASVNALCQNNFCHFPGLSRKPQWRTVTASKRGTHLVTKTPILNEEARFKLLTKTQEQPTLKQDLSNKKFHPGPLLLDQWLDAALHNDIASLSNLIEEYSAWLKSIQSQDNFTDIAYDLLPFNIIINDDGNKRQFNIIDSEWQLKEQYKADFVLFRALFWFAFENKAILKPFANTTKLTSIGLFICHFMDGFKHIDELHEFVEFEEKIQRQISLNFRKKSVEFALNQSFNSNNSMVKGVQPTCQISWGNKERIFDEANSVFLQWNKSNQPQLISSELTVSKDNTVLRVDPIASTGHFHFSSIRLLNSEKKVLWQMDTSEQIITNSSQFNLSIVANENQPNSFIALNNDPYFLFDLSAVKKLGTITNIEVDFALIQDENYDDALSSLSHIVNEQNTALIEQANGINEKLAEIAVLKAELTHVKKHRADIKSTLNDLQQSSAQQIKQLTEHASNLEHALMMRPLSRIKRLLVRLLGRR